MNVDLHCHSTNSDGTWSVKEILIEAERKGVKYLAITDHDNLKGSIEAFQLKKEIFSGELIAGIEISTKINGKSRHFLAYFPTVNLAENSELLQNLAKIRNSRVWRMKEMLKRAADTFDNFTITFEDVLQEAGTGQDGSSQPADVVSRPHLARLLHQRGYVSTFEQAFGEYIGDNGPLYVPRFSLEFDEWIRQVTDLGGFMVWAHPIHNNQENLKAFREIIKTVANSDVVGVEYFYNYKGKYEVSDAFEKQANILLKELIDEKNLLVTAGGDFHGNVGVLGELDLPEIDLKRFVKSLGL